MNFCHDPVPSRQAGHRFLPPLGASKNVPSMSFQDVARRRETGRNVSSLATRKNSEYRQVASPSPSQQLSHVEMHTPPRCRQSRISNVVTPPQQSVPKTKSRFSRLSDEVVNFQVSAWTMYGSRRDGDTIPAPCEQFNAQPVFVLLSSKFKTLMIEIGSEASSNTEAQRQNSRGSVEVSDSPYRTQNLYRLYHLQLIVSMRMDLC